MLIHRRIKLVLLLVLAIMVFGVFSSKAYAAVPPTLTIQAASSVSTSSATLNGTITSDGNASTTVRGFNYGTTTAYGLTASTTGTFGNGAFSQIISGLIPSTLYHVQAFSTNIAGIGTSSDITFTTLTAPPVISAISSSPGMTTVTITWTTDQNASSSVLYGLTSAYGATSTVDTLTMSHSISITGLSSSATYHFSVAGANNVGTVSTSSDQTFGTALSGCGTSYTLVGTTLYTTVCGVTTMSGSITPVYGPGYQPATSTATSSSAYGTSTAVTAPLGPSVSPTGCSSGALFDIYTGASCSNFSTTTNNTGALPMSGFLFTKNLHSGMTDPDVSRLQDYLNTHGFPVAPAGPGSINDETDYFGSATMAALIKFQVSASITPAKGYFGSITRAYINSH